MCLIWNGSSWLRIRKGGGTCEWGKKGFEFRKMGGIS